MQPELLLRRWGDARSLASLSELNVSFDFRVLILRSESGPRSPVNGWALVVPRAAVRPRNRVHQAGPFFGTVLGGYPGAQRVKPDKRARVAEE
jgi:hypothetical protein